MGRPPPMTTARIPYDVLERLNRLKKHKDEPIWKLVEEACVLLEERRDPNYYDENEERKRNLPKIQKRLTEKGIDVSVFVELTPKDTLERFVKDARLSGDTINEIKKVLGQTVLI